MPNAGLLRPPRSRRGALVDRSPDLGGVLGMPHAGVRWPSTNSRGTAARAAAIRSSWWPGAQTDTRTALQVTCGRRSWPVRDRLLTALEHERDAASARVACLNAVLEGFAESRTAGIQVPSA